MTMIDPRIPQGAVHDERSDDSVPSSLSTAGPASVQESVQASVQLQRLLEAASPRRERAALALLDRSVQRLREVQQARLALTRFTPREIRSALEVSSNPAGISSTALHGAGFAGTSGCTGESGA